MFCFTLYRILFNHLFYFLFILVNWSPVRPNYATNIYVTQIHNKSVFIQFTCRIVWDNTTLLLDYLFNLKRFSIKMMHFCWFKLKQHIKSHVGARSAERTLCPWLTTRWRHRLPDVTKPLFDSSTRCEWRFENGGRCWSEWGRRGQGQVVERAHWRAGEGEGRAYGREGGSEGGPAASETSQYLHAIQHAGQTAHQAGQLGRWVNLDENCGVIGSTAVRDLASRWRRFLPGAPPVPVKKSPATLPRNFTLPKEPHGSLLRGRISTPTGSPHLGALHPQLPPSCIIEELHRALATKHRQDRSDKHDTINTLLVLSQ